MAYSIASQILAVAGWIGHCRMSCFSAFLRVEDNELAVCQHDSLVLMDLGE